MKSEFALAFNQICAEYNLPKEVVLEAVRAALATAYRRDWRIAPTQNLTTEINLDTGLARIYVEKIVADPVADDSMEITLGEAKRINRSVQVGESVMVDVTPANFGRIAAQTAKQVITQRLREAEREIQFNRFSRQEGEIIIGTIQSVNPQGVTLHLERTEEAHMPKREQIPSERYTIHQKVRVYVVEVRRTPRGPEITVSRSHPSMLRRMLELEVPEIRNGQVEIKSIAREAGVLSKVAVAARQPGLDPVGACVGMRGIRIQTISRELNGERIEVMEWSADPAVFIANALRPATILSAVLDEHNPGGKTASVVVVDDQLSLAIGRAGQNARLAAKLTNWRVDIQGAGEAAHWALEQINRMPDLFEGVKVPDEIHTLIVRLGTILRTHDADKYPYSDEERRIIKTVIETVRFALIDRREREHPGARQAKARRKAQENAEAERRSAAEQARARVPAGAYATPISVLVLSEKTMGHLTRNGLLSVGDVMERLGLGDEALLVLDGIGARAIGEIKAAVDEYAAVAFVPEELPEADTTETVAELITDVLITSEISPVEIITEPELKSEPVVQATEPSAPAVQEMVTPEIPVPVVEIETASAVETTPDPAVESVAPVAPVGLPVEALGEIEFDDDDDEHSQKKRKKGKKGRAVFYGEENGEVLVVRNRKRGGSLKDMAWDNLEDY